MILQKLRLAHFRNFSNLEIKFAPEINYIIGENGQGKTNLLESIYCLALSRSFRTSNDNHLVQINEENYEIHGELLSELSVKHSISIVYVNKKKNVRYNQKKLPRHSSLIGIAPMVLFSPEDHRITGGPPAERRLFLDVLLSQSDKKYLKRLQEYGKLLRQRNRLLALIAEKQESADQLESWDTAIASSGFGLVDARTDFLEKIQEQLAITYSEISVGKGKIYTRYNFAEGIEIDGVETYLKVLKKLRQREIARKQTLVGPHRDDLHFFIGNRDTKYHSSRGEQKTVLLSLKIVEYNYLKNKKLVTPIFLLDDIHSELDQNRQLSLISKIAGLGQTFITSTERIRPRTQDDRTFLVKNGTIEFLHY
jgi:DNA replication and repair protein RecF